MDKIRIRSGQPLKGTIHIGGAKNAALPLLAACLLTDETLTLTNLPHVVDIATLANLLRQLGVSLTLNGHVAELPAAHLDRGCVLLEHLGFKPHLIPHPLSQLAAQVVEGSVPVHSPTIYSTRLRIQRPP